VPKAHGERLTAAVRESVAMVGLVEVSASYHIQIVEEEKLCRGKYARPYEEYLQKVPRHLVVKGHLGCLTTRSS
jgi:protein-S-isoprenylcysteine O-methyltransferase Ste14